MIKSEGLKKHYRKVTITLGEEQENFIDDVRKKIKRGGGFSLGRTEIIRAAIQFLKILRIDTLDLTAVKDEDDLLNRIKERHTSKPKERT